MSKIVDGIEYITKEEGRQIFDKRARELFGISGEEFIRKYRENFAQDLNELNHSRFVCLTMLIPMGYDQEEYLSKEEIQRRKEIYDNLHDYY